mmetsp:Transcript_109194/g.352420  ORF Transcript_109194/g.352420 Transcript_109194/m.352420 type:complete len:476 (+) Transcript_109194:1180-2607(+)
MLNARLPCGEVPLESVARPLSRLLEVPEAHSVAWRLDVARQVCRALAVLHRTGGAHGSFGPRNVWVDMEGHVSIMEVGLVDALLQSGVMHEHELLGLLGLEFAHYIAPEGWQMPREAGPKADMFSLGLVLLQVLDGAQAPHRECKSLQQLSAKMLPKRGRWTPTIKAGSLYSSLPQSVRSTIEACFKCSPVERPDVEDVLFAVLSVPQALAEVAELPESPAKDLQPSSVGGIEGEAGLRSPRRSLPEKLAAAFSEGDSQVFESEGTCGRPAEDSEETSPSAGSVVNVFSADLLPTLLEASSKVSAAAPKAELADGREFAASSSPDIKRPEPTTEAPADELAQLSKYFGCRRVVRRRRRSLRLRRVLRWGATRRVRHHRHGQSLRRWCIPRTGRQSWPSPRMCTEQVADGAMPYCRRLRRSRRRRPPQLGAASPPGPGRRGRWAGPCHHRLRRRCHTKRSSRRSRCQELHVHRGTL